TFKTTEFDVPPPGAGLTTVMDKSPTLVTSAARIVAFSCVELTKVVARELPLSRTVAPLRKLVPVTASVNPAIPAPTTGGLRAEIEGEPAAVIVKASEAALVPPPGVGVNTVT